MPCQLDPSEKIILALDGMDPSEAISLVSRIPKLTWVKIGLELFVSAGPDFISILRDKGKKIFLDLKFHDIPNTMEKACSKAAKSGAQLITVHACAGKKALLAANKGALEGASQVNMPSPTLLAVTVLTSWDDRSFNDELLIKESINERVELLAELASNCGIGGCICSPLEVSQLREKYPEPFELITPGIRLRGGLLNDQVRIMSPSEAINLGASRLVIGRPITSAIDPSSAFERFYREISSC